MKTAIFVVILFMFWIIGLMPFLIQISPPIIIGIAIGMFIVKLIKSC